jgi:hypothetical protein
VAAPGFAHSIARQTNGRSSPSLGSGGATLAPIRSLAMRSTVESTEGQPDRFVPVDHGGVPTTTS